MIGTKFYRPGQMELYLKNDVSSYQLSENQIIKLKEFLELHFKMENEFRSEIISGADEVLNLLGRYVIISMVSLNFV